MQQETLLYANTATDTADRDAADMAALIVGTDDKALENLDAFFAAFANTLMDTHGVACTNINDS